MSTARNDKDPLPGKQLLDRYVIIGKIGSGAVSDVYLVRQASVGNRNVAVKIVKKIICASDSEEAAVHRSRFKWEAELMSMLKGASFARILDVGVLEDGVERPFVLMEYLAGVTLEEHLKAGQRFPLPMAIRLFLALAEAVVELHRYKVVYRDLSPGNVILEEGGAYGLVPRLFDFSHSTLVGIEALEANGVTGQLLAGTPPYAAPELASGGGDERSDVFSLAGVFYALASGAAPLELHSTTWPDYVSALSSGRTLPDKSLRSRGIKIPRRLDQVLATALAPRQDDRYPSVGLFVADFCKAVLRSPALLLREGGDSLLLNLMSRFLIRD